MPTRRLLPPILIALAVTAAPALAQSPAAVLERLGSPDYAVREAATGELLRDDTLDVAALAELFATAATPEQRHRLLGVLRHHAVRHYRETDFPREGDPAIGFSHDIRSAETPGGGAVIFVVETLPGFPGHAHLRAGDLITAIDGEPFSDDLDNDLFKARLRRHQAGDTLRLTLRRDGRPVTLELELATSNALDRLYTQTPILQEPYRSRWTALRDRLLAQAPPARTIAIPGAP